MKASIARVAGLSLACSLMHGCALVGPSSIASGRQVYNEVINRTGDEQLLNMIVRERYGETFGMLSVASVTANIKVGGSAGAEFGFGSDTNYAGNLVPLSVGAAYEENPTISYIPLGGEEFLTKLLTPLTIDQAILISRASERTPILKTLVRRVNGLDNPAVGNVKSNDEFDRVVALNDALRAKGILNVARHPAADRAGADEFFTVIANYASAVDEVQEYLDLLGIDSVRATGADLAIPFRISLGLRSRDAIQIELLSVIDVIRAVGYAIEIPAEHLEQGIVDPVRNDPNGTRPLVQVRSSKDRPRFATVAIQVHGWWFYIDATDTQSKGGFGLLRTLIGMRLESDGGKAQVPVLTISTSG